MCVCEREREREREREIRTQRMFSINPTKLIVFCEKLFLFLDCFSSKWSQIATDFDSKTLAKNWEERIKNFGQKSLNHVLGISLLD